jgi:hypothetical protein
MNFTPIFIASFNAKHLMGKNVGVKKTKGHLFLVTKDGLFALIGDTIITSFRCF